MYSKIGLRLIRISFLPSALLATNSIRFNPKTKTFYTTQFSSRKLLLGSTLLICFAVFVFWRTIQIFLWRGGKSNPYFHICYAFSFTFLIGSSSLIYLNVYQKSICQVQTQMVRYCCQFEGD